MAFKVSQSAPISWAVRRNSRESAAHRLSFSDRAHGRRGTQEEETRLGHLSRKTGHSDRHAGHAPLPRLEPRLRNEPFPLADALCPAQQRLSLDSRRNPTHGQRRGNKRAINRFSFPVFHRWPLHNLVDERHLGLQSSQNGGLFF